MKTLKGFPEQKCTCTSFYSFKNGFQSEITSREYKIQIFNVKQKLEYDFYSIGLV